MKKVSAILIGLISMLTSWLGTLAIPVYILVGCNIIDYITGIIAAESRKQQVSSYKGMVGIAKKVLMYLLIVIGVFVDIMLQYMFSSLNINIVLPFIVGCIVACWLVFNEIISILENLNDSGVPMPPFLMPIVKRIRGTVEKKGDEMEESIPKEEKDGE